jgi:hypothetical protein
LWATFVICKPIIQHSSGSIRSAVSVEDHVEHHGMSTMRTWPTAAGISAWRPQLRGGHDRRLHEFRRACHHKIWLLNDTPSRLEDAAEQSNARSNETFSSH